MGELILLCVVLSWLKGSDPSIKFQTMRDIEGCAETEWKKEQKIVTTEGWGKKLLDLQAVDGTWGGGLYSPKFVSTHYTLLLLRRMEMLPNKATAKGCDQLIKIQSIGDIDIASDRIGTCITGMGLGILAHFNSHEELYDNILQFLVSRQLDDGAWNCRHPRVKTNHSSLNTTLSVLEGLEALGKTRPEHSSQIEELISPAHEFLLAHQLYKSHTTGKEIHSAYSDISFPPRWKYNILSALDYLQRIDFPYDERMDNALDLLQSYEKKGKWGKGRKIAGNTHFDMDEPRQPSYWNTLRAIRVLQRYRNYTVE